VLLWYLSLDEKPATTKKPHDQSVNYSPLFQPKNIVLEIIAYNYQTIVC
jgi:hypothetical protein